MNMPAVNPQPARAFELPIATFLRLQNRRTRISATLAVAVGGDIAARVVPPMIVIELIALVLEVLCRKQGATLHPPSRVIDDTWDLITDPFFDNGGLDKGLFWHLSASLQRVAQGYALASIVGVALGTLV